MLGSPVPATATFAHRARRSSTWLDRQRRRPFGDRLRAMAVQQLAGRVGVAGGNRPAGAQAGLPRPAVLRPIVLRQRLCDIVRGDAAAFASDREGARGAGYSSVWKRDVYGGDATRVLGADRLAGGAVQSAGDQAFRLLGRGAPVSRRGWRRSLAPVGERQRTDADPSQRRGRRSVCLAPDEACGMSGLPIVGLRNGAGSAAIDSTRGIGRAAKADAARATDLHEQAAICLRAWRPQRTAEQFLRLAISRRRDAGRALLRTPVHALDTEFNNTVLNRGTHHG